MHYASLAIIATILPAASRSLRYDSNSSGLQHEQIASRANLSHSDAISSQLPTRRLDQIDFGSSGKTKLDRYLGTHLEAAPADSGPDRHHQILGFTAKLPTHRVHGFRRNLRYNASPSGVNRGHRPIFRVGDQNRETIGSSNRQADARRIRDQCIALALQARPIPPPKLGPSESVWPSPSDCIPGHPPLSRVPNPCWSHGKASSVSARKTSSLSRRNKAHCNLH